MYKIGLDCLQMPVLCEGYAFNNKMCSIHIKGQIYKLLILITDALAQWRVGNARVTVSIHRNTLKDGILLSTWIREGMNNPLSSLVDLFHNTLIVLLEVFLTTSHPIVIVHSSRRKNLKRYGGMGNENYKRLGGSIGVLE